MRRPDDVAQQAHAMASATQRRVEDAAVEWIRNAVRELPVTALPDERVLELCDANLSEADQAELSELLARQREGILDAAGRQRMDELMRTYRRGWC